MVNIAIETYEECENIYEVLSNSFVFRALLELSVIDTDWERVNTREQRTDYLKREKVIKRIVEYFKADWNESIFISKLQEYRTIEYKKAIEKRKLITNPQINTVLWALKAIKDFDFRESLHWVTAKVKTYIEQLNDRYYDIMQELSDVKKFYWDGDGEVLIDDKLNFRDKTDRGTIELIKCAESWLFPFLPEDLWYVNWIVVIWSTREPLLIDWRYYMTDLLSSDYRISREGDPLLKCYLVEAEKIENRDWNYNEKKYLLDWKWGIFKIDWIAINNKKAEGSSELNTVEREKVYLEPDWSLLKFECEEGDEANLYWQVISNINNEWVKIDWTDILSFDLIDISKWSTTHVYWYKESWKYKIYKVDWKIISSIWDPLETINEEFKMKASIRQIELADNSAVYINNNNWKIIYLNEEWKVSDNNSWYLITSHLLDQNWDVYILVWVKTWTSNTKPFRVNGSLFDKITGI